MLGNIRTHEAEVSYTTLRGIVFISEILFLSYLLIRRGWHDRLAMKETERYQFDTWRLKTSSEVCIKAEHCGSVGKKKTSKDFNDKSEITSHLVLESIEAQ